MMKQIAVQAIASALLLSLLSACGSSGTTEVQTTADTAPQTTETVTEAGPAFPDVTFGGEDIHFLTEENNQYSSIEIYSAGADGSLINDTVYNRNMVIEERFDVRITEERLSGAHTTAYNSVMAGEDEYDVVLPYLNNSVSNATQGLYLNLFDVENLHLENTWWDQRANENLQVGGKLYFTTGDISILDNECTMVLFFNKQMIAENDLADPYQMVKSGTWTLDAMFEMCSGISADLNGDGTMKDTDDRYGLFCAFNTPHSLYFATGERIVTTDQNGQLQLVMNNERSVSAATEILELCLDPAHLSNGFDSSVKAFMEGRLLFTGWALTDINSIRDCQYDFGILPYPKYDEKQSDYCSLISTILTPGVSIPVTNNEPEKAGLILEALAYYSVDTLTNTNSIRDCQYDFGILPYPKYDEKQSDYYSLISTILTPGVSIPVTNNEPEKAGLILEALAYYSVDTLTHAYYDTALNNRYIRDEDSGEMLDIIFASRVYDFGFIFDVGGMGTLIQTMFNSRKNNFASEYEKRESKAQSALADLMASFEGA